MIRKTFKFFQNYYYKKRIEKIINNVDKKTDFDSKFKGYKFKKNAIDVSALKEEINNRNLNFKKSIHLREITKNIAKTSLQATNLFYDEIIDYLGENARLDDIYVYGVKLSTSENRSVSGSWHHDGCGRRLKLYIAIDANLNSPTIILPNNSSEYAYSIKDSLRVFSKDIKNREDQISFAYESGDAAIFDTNFLHRGVYERDDSTRLMLVIEFIDRIKSNMISGYAPCGPGGSSSNSISISNEVKDILLKTKLIDDSILREEKNMNYSYSINNLYK